jgi:hypothetical protein
MISVPDDPDDPDDCPYVVVLVVQHSDLDSDVAIPTLHVQCLRRRGRVRVSLPVRYWPFTPVVAIERIPICDSYLSLTLNCLTHPSTNPLDLH